MEPLRLTFGIESIDNIPFFYYKAKQKIKNIIELSQKFVNDNLNVIRYQSNLVYPKWSTDCHGVVVPDNSEDKINGIPNSDLHIYAYVYSDLEDSSVAFGGACLIRDVDNDRKFEDYFEVVMHEITHVLGFSSGLFQYYKNPKTGVPYGKDNLPIIQKLIRGQQTNILTTPKIVELTRKYYGCPTAEGMQLENQGGGGSINSHWERTIIENEYMTPSVISHDAAISEFTLTLLEDSGWYERINKKSDNIDWGKGKGCKFLESCNPDEFREFNSSPQACSFYHSGIGFYNPQYQDRFADQCHITLIYSNRHCNDIQNSSNFDQYSGNLFAEQSRCFKSNIKYVQSFSGEFRCLAYDCTKEGTELSVIVFGEKYAFNKQTNKVNIINKGSNTKFEGYVEAPEDWKAFCNSYHKPCPSFCSAYGYCFAEECHCISNYAGKDCSIGCANGNYVFQNQCLNTKQCPAGTILNTPTKECICPPNQYMLNGVCVNQCPISYYAQGETCLKCDPSCVECSESQFCLACKPGYNVFTYSGKIDCYKTCPEGFIKSANENICIPCKINCKSCSQIEYCDECISSTYKLYDTVNISKFTCVNKCPEGTYLNQLKNECSNCKEFCSQCSISQGKLCDICKEGYHLNSQKQCIKCVDNCESCEAHSSCTVCKVNFYLLKLDQLFYCLKTCPARMFADKNEQICQNCMQNCEKCEAIDTCSECINQYYFNKELKKCETCSKNCLLCSNFQNCLQCKEGYQLNESNNQETLCQLQCPKGQFAKDNEKCQVCSQNCDSCTEQNTCLKCKEQTYLDKQQKQCIQCSQALCLQCEPESTCFQCVDNSYQYINQGRLECLHKCPKGYNPDDNKLCFKLINTSAQVFKYQIIMLFVLISLIII